MTSLKLHDVVGRCKEEYEVHDRKRQIFGLGEDLFGLPHQTYTQLDQTEKELDYLSQLYGLYTAVLETIGRWKDYLWVDVPAQMESMKKEAPAIPGIEGGR
eukprot:s450_g15.t1